MFRLDRFGRSPVELLAIVAMLKERGIECYAILRASGLLSAGWWMPSHQPSAPTSSPALGMFPSDRITLKLLPNN
ncbi:hypothetical protein [Methylobacterium nodulans]|uniref:hypothetical protein n=1 Tax=Methylobacterium nodulans TaxID=114616 RepID=UPI003CC721BE